jgi:hypothetical protein
VDLEIASKIFSGVAEVGPEFVGSSFGEVGEKIFSLFEVLGNHPESDGFFFEHRDLEVRDLMKMALHAKEKGMDSFISKLPKIAELYASAKLKSSKVPGRNGYAARLLRKPKKDLARSFRRTQRLGSSSFMRSATKNWNCVPSSFGAFRRDFLASAHPEPLEEAARKFGEIGCDHLASAASELVARYIRPPCSYGYKRLGVVDACHILAKSCGFVLGESLIIGRSPSGWFRYSPFVLPLHVLKNIPERVSSSVNHAEFNSSLYFDSVFDHYLVLAPFLGDRVDVGFAGEVNFPDADDCVSSLERGELDGVVLGERDGECYFICEWN